MTALKELFDLSGRVAVVTGGSTGLGLQMAEAMAEFGAKVVICARKADRLATAEAKLRDAYGAEVLTVACDVARAEAVTALHDQVMERFGGVDILVNNAGRAWVAPVEDMPLERWQQVFDLNITAPFMLAQAFGRHMIVQKKGSIINIASIAGLVGRNPDAYNSIAYGASKGALVNFTRDLSVKWARHNIRVNAICPGFFVTDINRKVYDERPEKIDREIPLGKPGGDSDIKGAAVWLASDASRFVTGAIIPVDGGTTAW
ncbi:MAG: SDR family oxidoreductase [bacterium]|jgi:gluconate 5-dehydrogenase|nr:SDR family oxidoreductase [Betaproteobacteria bacterium]